MHINLPFRFDSFRSKERKSSGKGNDKKFPVESNRSKAPYSKIAIQTISFGYFGSFAAATAAQSLTHTRTRTHNTIENFRFSFWWAVCIRTMLRFFKHVAEMLWCFCSKHFQFTGKTENVSVINFSANGRSFDGWFCGACTSKHSIFTKFTRIFTDIECTSIEEERERGTERSRCVPLCLCVCLTVTQTVAFACLNYSLFNSFENACHFLHCYDIPWFFASFSCLSFSLSQSHFTLTRSLTHPSSSLSLAHSVCRFSWFYCATKSNCNLWLLHLNININSAYIESVCS